MSIRTTHACGVCLRRQGLSPACAGDGVKRDQVTRSRDRAVSGSCRTTPGTSGQERGDLRPERVDLDWAQANFLRVWRAQAPKRLLKAYEAEHGTPAE